MSFHDVYAAESIPLDVRIVLYRVQREIDCKNYEKAKKILMKYISKNKSRPQSIIYYSLGNIWYLQKNLKNAFNAYSEAYRLNPKSFVTCVNFAKVCYETKRYEQSGNLFSHAYKIAKKPDGELLYEAGVAYFQGRKYLQASKVLERLVEKNRQVKEAWTKLLIYTYMQLKAWNKAEHLVQVFLDKDKTNAYYWKLLSELRIRKGEYAGAASALEIAYRLGSPGKEDWKQLANIYYYLDIPLKAVRCLEEAFGGDPSSKECCKLAAGYAKAYRLKKAIYFYNLAIQKKAIASQYLELGELYYRNGMWKEAIKALEGCLHLKPNHGLANLLLGYCAWESGNRSLARRAFLKAEKNKKYRTQAYDALNVIKEDSIALKESTLHSKTRIAE